MAFGDSADLLLRTKDALRLPASTEEIDDAGLYRLLSDAQREVVVQIANVVPEVMYVHEKLTTADGGVSYTFLKEPLGDYELRQSPTGRLLIPAPEWDMAGDFVPNGQSIRFPGQKAKSFSNGPWARYVKTPADIDAGTQPTLLPVLARSLLPPTAAALFARRGGLRDPAPYEAMANRIWYGDPDRGHYGLLVALREQVFLKGSEAIPAGGGGEWWHYIDNGDGYVPGSG